MKAWVLHNVGDIRMETLREPDLAENEVLVAVKAAGICGSDILRIYQTGAHVHPLVPGHEFSGVVAKTGKDVDKNWKGMRVAVCPLIPCRSCLQCQKQQYEMCRNYDYLGSRRDGGFAEYAAVPAANLLPIPDHLSFEEAAMLEPMAVAVHAMRRVLPKTSEMVVVCGLGTIGMLLLMFLQAAGIRNIYAVGNKEYQKHIVLKMGLAEEYYCDSTMQNVSQWMVRHSGGYGTDVFFDCVGKNETFVQALKSTMPGGKVCLVGNPDSDIKLEKQVYWTILCNQITVSGIWNASFTNSLEDDWHFVLDRVSAKQVHPMKLITHRFSIEEMEHGWHIMRDKLEDYVKIMGIYG